MFKQMFHLDFGEIKMVLIARKNPVLIACSPHTICEMLGSMQIDL